MQKQNTVAELISVHFNATNVLQRVWESAQRSSRQLTVSQHTAARTSCQGLSKQNTRTEVMKWLVSFVDRNNLIVLFSEDLAIYIFIYIYVYGFNFHQLLLIVVFFQLPSPHYKNYIN